MRWRSKLLGVVVATVLVSSALALGLTSPAWAAESITLSPTSGPVGTAVTVNGSGWQAGTGLTVQWNCGWFSTDRRVIAKVTADSGGSWSVRSAVPANCITQGSEVWVEALGGPNGSPAGVFNLTSGNPPGHPPRILLPVETVTDGVLVWVKVRYEDPAGDTAGFGFRGAKGSGWAEETHPFSSPGYGRTFPGGVEYPFNHNCGRSDQYQSDVEFWVYDATGLRSTPVLVHLACTQQPTTTPETGNPGQPGGVQQPDRSGQGQQPPGPQSQPGGPGPAAPGQNGNPAQPGGTTGSQPGGTTGSQPGGTTGSQPGGTTGSQFYRVKLPYPSEPDGQSSYRVTQGNHGSHTHCTPGTGDYCLPGEEYAFDFAMPDGAPVAAAQDGIVKKVRGDSSSGGCGPKFANDANYVLLDHQDGKTSLYLHLLQGSLRVNEGDVVPQGQIIGQADHSGWTCGSNNGAHLHFQVQVASGQCLVYCQSISVFFEDLELDGTELQLGVPYKSGNSPQ